MAAPMQSQVPSVAQQQTGQQPPQSVQQSDIDPITKFKLLLPRLKDSLIALCRVAGQMFKVNAAQDSGGQSEIQQHRSERFEKSLEDFCGICDQIEVNLRLALELYHQTEDSLRNTPLSIVLPVQKSESTANPQEGQSYAQYLTTVRTQINFAKEIHDLLHEQAMKLLEKPQLPPMPSQQQQTQQE
ncbi:hypothetical protein C0Q70_13292 [Pomacea canaliculata]|uniref:Mediator of RNA polymerase II transcription subunit 29 n=1 Tax=Pomacea canaliculata TaxID=400727 RepID=A0A2T7NWU9_POMCA|nr:mediator of RNA polymerase II transcription subunit 29-like [Pomacea canaliculata]PVD25633.1 hypothetical protein C0Q70_13292 [Pomacea canaliculata]